MNLQSFKNTKGLVILLSSITILLIYLLDIQKLSYPLKVWKTFGKLPVPAELQFFVANTPNLIGYTDPESKTSVSCATTVAYVKTASNETYRCCDTGSRISCLGGDFSNEIPVIDEACTDNLKEAFGISSINQGSTENLFYGSCSTDSSQLTVVQMDDNGQILWKLMDVEEILFLIGVLRCVLAPLLLALIVVIVILTARAVPKEPIPRF
ncbi:MAG TPA: hypothetical protein VGK56_16690 [Anaerolineales bacterium]